MNSYHWVFAVSAGMLLVAHLRRWWVSRHCPSCGVRLRLVGLLHETQTGFSDLLRCYGCDQQFERRGLSVVRARHTKAASKASEHGEEGKS